MNSKGDVAITHLLAAILVAILFVITAVCFFGGPCIGPLERLKALIPAFRLTTENLTESSIIGYNIGQDKAKYYDGVNWHEFPSELEYQKKKITSGNVRYYFADNYFFNNNLRERSLKTIDLQDTFSYAVITGIITSSEENTYGIYTIGKISNEENRGKVIIALEQKSSSKEYLGKIFRIGEKTNIDYQMFFRYNGDSWEWTSNMGKEIVYYQPTGREQWQTVSANPQGEIPTGLKETIKELAGKDFESGKKVLMQEISSTPYEEFVFNAWNSGGTAQNNPLIQEIYLRYVNNWEWSVDNINWINVNDQRITYKTGEGIVQTSGPFVEFINRELIIALRGKNLEQGKDIILKTKTSDDKTPIETFDGTFTLTLNNQLLTDEKSKDLAISKKEIIKQKAIAWRDSVFEKPMLLKFDTGEEEYFCVEKFPFTNPGNKFTWVLTIDLSKEVARDSSCST